MVRGLLLGLGGGLLCGWLVFRDVAPERLVAERKTPPISDSKRVPPAPTQRATLASGHARPLADIDRAMQGARAEKNWPEFLGGIRELIGHDSPEADARLVAILRDESLRLPQRIGRRFFEGLKNSTEPRDVRGAAETRDEG